MIRQDEMLVGLRGSTMRQEGRQMHKIGFLPPLRGCEFFITRRVSEGSMVVDSSLANASGYDFSFPNQ